METKPPPFHQKAATSVRKNFSARVIFHCSNFNPPHLLIQHPNQAFRGLYWYCGCCWCVCKCWCWSVPTGSCLLWTSGKNKSWKSTLSVFWPPFRSQQSINLKTQAGKYNCCNWWEKNKARHMSTQQERRKLIKSSSFKYVSLAKKNYEAWCAFSRAQRQTLPKASSKKNWGGGLISVLLNCGDHSLKQINWSFSTMPSGAIAIWLIYHSMVDYESLEGKMHPRGRRLPA